MRKAASPAFAEGICPVCGRRGRGRCSGCGQAFVALETESSPGQVENQPVQRHGAGGLATLATTPANRINPLGQAELRRFSNLLNSGNSQGVIELIAQVMTQRGEIDSQLMVTQAVPSHHLADCQQTNPYIVDPGVNGANAMSCGCITAQTGTKLPNPRIRINLNAFLSRAVSVPHPNQSFHEFLAAILHSTLFHEFRHVRQQFETCQNPGGGGSGICTDCNDPTEMDAYLSEIEAGYNPQVYRYAWVRVHTNWDYLSPAQQAVFANRRAAAEQKINRAFPNVNWAADPDVARYLTHCQSLDQRVGGNSRGQCNSTLAPTASPTQTSSLGDVSRPAEEEREA